MKNKQSSTPSLITREKKGPHPRNKDGNVSTPQDRGNGSTQPRRRSRKRTQKAQSSNCKQKLRKAQSTAANAETPPESKNSPLKTEIKAESSKQAEKLQQAPKQAKKQNFSPSRQNSANSP
jgi:hypothetical protein